MNTAIILAAGKGTRMKAGMNKQFIELHGKPILAYTLDKFDQCIDIDCIILVVSKEDKAACEEILLKYQYKKVSRLVLGGQERQDSVYNGLSSLDKDCDVVLIHDGARPFVSTRAIADCIEAARSCGAASAGVPVKDTIKIVTEQQRVNYTPNRKNIWITQTPQAFRCSLIKEAHQKAREQCIAGTDDAMLLEQLGFSVQMVFGEYENIKITTPEDLSVAEAILKNAKSL